MSILKSFTDVSIYTTGMPANDVVAAAQLKGINPWYAGPEFTGSASAAGYKGPLRVITLGDWVDLATLDQQFEAEGLDHVDAVMLAALALQNRRLVIPYTELRVTFALGQRVATNNPDVVLLPNLWSLEGYGNLGLLAAISNYELRPGDQVLAISK